jgi:hypothetical protein
MSFCKDGPLNLKYLGHRTVGGSSIQEHWGGNVVKMSVPVANWLCLAS